MIVPCYRYGRFLRECVESVLTQSVPDVRVLIIDDASPDNTVEVAAELISKDSRVTFIRHAVNRGHIATYNEGIQWAAAKYLLILSADDYLLPGALSRAAALMDSHPEVGFTFGRAIEVSDGMERPSPEDFDELRSYSSWQIFAGPDFIENCGATNIVSTPTAVVRTELQKRLGGYRAELPHAGDMEMWLRFAAHASVGRLHAYQAVYRQHEENMSLAYTSGTWLPDLQQRKAALDCLFQSCGCVLPNAERLRRKLIWSLGCCAIGFASSSFNDKQLEVSERLLRFAQATCPGIRWSLPWIKLACKRRLGAKSWQMLQAIAAGICRAVLLRPGQ